MPFLQPSNTKQGTAVGGTTDGVDLYLSANGGTINGDITAEYIVANSGLELKDNSDPRNTIFTVAAATNGATGNPIIQVRSGASLRFGLVSQANANTTFTPSAPGANTDKLTVGGLVATNSLSMLSTGAGPTSGKSAVVVGTSFVIINSTAITADSLIFLTYNGIVSAGPGGGSAQGLLVARTGVIVPGVSFGVFLTSIDGISIAAAGQDATFNWMFIN